MEQPQVETLTDLQLAEQIQIATQMILQGQSNFQALQTEIEKRKKSNDK